MATKSQNLGMFLRLSAQWKPFVSVRILSNKTLWRIHDCLTNKNVVTSLSAQELRLRRFPLAQRSGLRTIIYSSANLDRCAIFASISWNSRKTRGFKTPRGVTDLNFVQVLQVLCQTKSIMHRKKNQVIIYIYIESILNQNDEWEPAAIETPWNFQCLNTSAIQCPMSSRNFGIRARRAYACCAPPCYSKLARNMSVEDFLVGDSNPFESY